MHLYCLRFLRNGDIYNSGQKSRAHSPSALYAMFISMFILHPNSFQTLSTLLGRGGKLKLSDITRATALFTDLYFVHGFAVCVYLECSPGL